LSILFRLYKKAGNSLLMKKILVLGGTGFVGRNVMKVFEAAGMDAVSASLSSGVDLRNAPEVAALLALTRPDIIINCAARVGSLNYVTTHAVEVITDNTKMALALYEAVAATNPAITIIHPIANCAYPGKATLYVEDEWWDGPLHNSVFAYGSTRRQLWSIGESYRMQTNIRSIYLLVPNMYGPFDSTNPDKAHALNALISKFVKAQNEGVGEIVIWGSGIAIREWLYAEDFGRILLDIVNDPDLPQLAAPLNIAQKYGLSIKELVGIIIRHFTYTGKVNWDTTMPDGAPKKVMDDTRFRATYPAFAFTPLDEGIRETIAYYQSVYPY
jgi:GDP-L-fucose synthase